MMLARSKKGMGILGAILAVVIIIVLIGMFTNTWGKQKLALDSQGLIDQTNACKAEVQNAIRKGIAYVDLDQDECLDTFDVCLDVPGGEAKDTDLDGRPDVCDKEKEDAENNPTIFGCAKGFEIKAGRDQCCTQGYKELLPNDPGKLLCE